MALETLHANAASRQMRLSWALSPAFLVAICCYVFLIILGNQMLRDADTYWQIAVGSWIMAERQMPQVDVFSHTLAGKHWISSQWLAQVFFASIFERAGWAGIVALTAAAIASAFGLLSHFLLKRLALIPSLVLVTAAFILTSPHLVARPHALALPIMVAWVAGLLSAVEAQRRPPLPLLLLMVAWANLHGGFTFGIFMIGPLALEALLRAETSQRLRVFLQWFAFGLAALLAACITPYGPESILVTQRILGLGPALDLIGEWQPQNFAHLTGFGICMLLGIGFALYRGVTLPLIRILVLTGLLYMALSHVRNSEILALLGPLFLAGPLALQLGKGPLAGPRPGLIASTVVVLLLAAGTVPLASVIGPRPAAAISPAFAVEQMQKTGKYNLLNSYDFGGYLIANGVKPFVDGRTELYGSDFMVKHDRAVMLTDLSTFFDLMNEYDIDVTLLAPGTPAIGLLDRLEGWRRVYADAIAVVHVREADTTTGSILSMR